MGNLMTFKENSKELLTLLTCQQLKSKKKSKTIFKNWGHFVVNLITVEGIYGIISALKTQKFKKFKKIKRLALQGLRGPTCPVA